MAAEVGSLRPALGVVAVLAHAISIIGLGGVAALGNILSVFLYLLRLLSELPFRQI